MSQHFFTPADHWRGVRGPVVLTVALLLLGAFSLFIVGRVRHQRQAVEYERTITIRQAQPPIPAPLPSQD